MVTPLGLISSKMPHIFSRGECRLTMTIELGSINLSSVKLQFTARSGEIRDEIWKDVPYPSAPGSFSGSFVGAVEPLERVVQVRIGTQCEREPSITRGVPGDAAVAFGSLRKGRRHDFHLKKDRGVGTESPGVGESGENSYATIKGAESEHALDDHAGPGEQFGFEQGRPAPRLFRDGQKLRPRGRRFLALCRRLIGFHRHALCVSRRGFRDSGFSILA